jgi:hypothetical protein
MSTIATQAITVEPPTGRLTAGLRRTTVAAGFAGAAATTAVAAALRAAGTPLSVEGRIPLLGFAQITFIAAVLGGLIAAVLNRRSAQPRRRFVQVAVTLTALSCILPLAMASGAADKLALATTHLVAAAIIIPVLARRVDA